MYFFKHTEVIRTTPERSQKYKTNLILILRYSQFEFNSPMIIESFQSFMEEQLYSALPQPTRSEYVSPLLQEKNSLQLPALVLQRNRLSLSDDPGSVDDVLR
jgi:hypothetical protein